MITNRNRRSWAIAAACVAPMAFATMIAAQPPPSSWKLIGWNDLGMHCMDSDYAVFSILPPFNNVKAQLINPAGHLVSTLMGVTVTYEGTADPSGSTNISSAAKTNFWMYANALYGSSSVPNTGLAGYDMPGPANAPQAMGFDAASALFHADGVPITPIDDAGHSRTYPMMQLVARSSMGSVLASADVVLPVSAEMDCSLCHASGAVAAAQPAAGWVYHRNQIRDYRLNILRLHDELQAANPTYQTALVAAGYQATGLHATAVSGTPILCARCHASNALPGTGMSGISPLTQATHAGHAQVLDPITGMTLESNTNRASCYRCHPGSDTRCLRGAMGNAVAANGSRAMQCQSCHGSMLAVGAASRQGWFEEPSCQNCHTGTATNNNGQIRYTSAFDVSGALRQAVNATFATNPNAPATGLSLYRFSRGHGGLSCEACHGSTHAEYPSAHVNDNVQVTALQGHVGTLVECAACHQGMPVTVTGGPHGMHPVGQSWVDGHPDVVETSGSAQCRVCHGTDYRGTELSRMHADRTLITKYGTRSTWRGERISCYACHLGPNSGDPNPNRAPRVQDAAAATATAAVVVTLVASDPDNNPLTLRIVQQPEHGRVALSGNLATYYPEPGFAGDDPFTFAAWDGAIDSNLGNVVITRLATWANYGVGYPGSGGLVPTLTVDRDPVLGTAIQLQIGNVVQVPTVAALVFSTERASLPTAVGGLLLTELTAVVTVVLPTQTTAFQLAVPNVPAMLGLSVHFQAAAVDSGARFQVAFTPGLSLTLGR